MPPGRYTIYSEKTSAAKKVISGMLAPEWIFVSFREHRRRCVEKMLQSRSGSPKDSSNRTQRPNIIIFYIFWQGKFILDACVSSASDERIHSGMISHEDRHSLNKNATWHRIENVYLPSYRSTRVERKHLL